jgi:hypothetical protein
MHPLIEQPPLQKVPCQSDGDHQNTELAIWPLPALSRFQLSTKIIGSVFMANTLLYGFGSACEGGA